MSRPVTRNENSGTITGPGAMARPDLSADQPQSSCIHSTMDSSMAPKATENSSVTSEAPEKLRTRNSAGSISGLRCRAQRAANAATSSSETASTPAVRADAQPQLPPWTSPRVSPPTPAVISSAARASGLGPGWPGASGSRSQPAASAARPIGTFTKKTQRQLSVTSRPPATGPSAAAMPPAAVQARTAPPRRCAG